MIFKDWLAQWVDRERLSPGEAAARLGIDASMVSRYLNGRLLPSRTTAGKIANATGTPLADVLAMADEQQAASAPPTAVPVLTPQAWEQVAIQTVGHAVWDDLDAEAKSTILRLVMRGRDKGDL